MLSKFQRDANSRSLGYPDSADAQLSLAEAYVGNGDARAAIVSYTKALRLDPSNRQAAEALRKLQGR